MAPLKNLAGLRGAVDEDERSRLVSELQSSGVSESLIAVFIHERMLLAQADESLSLRFEVGSSVPVSFFEALIDYFDQQGVERYHASLFDSSSGGAQVWDKPELDIELWKSRIYLLGEFDPEEELEESLAGEQATLVDTLSECNLVIVGEDPDLELLKQVHELNITVVTEEDIWDYMM